MTDINKLRHRCFFDINIGDKSVGRIVFELFNDICPKTCDNFRSLCTGEKGLGKTTGKPLHYKNVLFHRVVKGFIIQSGDFSMGNGKGGESIFGGTFNDENFVLKHEKPFLLSMANRGKNTNGSQFFITLNPAPHLDGVHVVFGHVLSGHQVITEIQNQETGDDGRPIVDVLISNCGELIPQIKQKDKKNKKHKKEKKSDGELSTDDEEREASKKKKKDKRHKKQKKSKENKTNEKDEDSNEDKKEDKELEEINANCSVKPEEIPDIPQNKFLMRDTQRDEKEREGKRDYGIQRNNRYDRNTSRRRVKGRGPTRYRTPSPHHYRSGSETPPHWRDAQKGLKTLKEAINDKQRNPRNDQRDDQRDDRLFNRRGSERSRWQRPLFGRSNRDFDIRDRFQRESSDTEVKDNTNRQISHRKRVFTEEPPLNSKHLKRDSSPLNGSNQREQNENNVTSFVSDSENVKTPEIVRHSVKSEVKLNVRNKRNDSNERGDPWDHFQERRHQSPLDLKNIPLPDSDPEKKKTDEKKDYIRSERTFDSNSKRERRHRRSSSRERTSSRRQKHSNDSN